VAELTGEQISKERISELSYAVQESVPSALEPTHATDVAS
jgi:hypothetical protein